MFFSALTTTYRRLYQNARLIGGLYLTNVAFALLVALPLQVLLQNTVGKSLAIQQLMPSVDYTVISDFLRTYRVAWGVITQETLLLILLYGLLFIFLMGGIVTRLCSSSDTSFLTASTTHFWRVLRLSVYFILLYLLLLIIIGGIFTQIFIENFASFNSEHPVVKGAIIFLSIFVLVAMLVTIVRDYAKVQLIIQPQQSVFKTFWRTWRFVFRHKRVTIPMFILHALLLVILLALYMWGSGYLHPLDNTSKIIFAFLLSQLFLIGRIIIQLSHLASVTTICERISVAESKQVPSIK